MSKARVHQWLERDAHPGLTQVQALPGLGSWRTCLGASKALFCLLLCLLSLLKVALAVQASHQQIPTTQDKRSCPHLFPPSSFFPLEKVMEA